ncbi:uncharacterized protein LOC119265232 isoform X3 [Pygocentrus nattereri]|uniref:uncharacterized protein LOC119265232 isoform X3 n=1 Tax=Pygocentrus nattereri TaxID=42514 RepID=UPI001890F8D4|nr:uncharacterized protein LOC119265232 isoform X3 [Pygocentrus nattereri]
MPPRISPLKDAIQHVVSKTDKTCRLEVKYINAVKGRGVFAKGSICKGDFVVEYRGDMINDAESQRRRKLYHPSCAAFMFAFKWRGKTWCIDAAREDGSFGRLVNDEHQHPNCRMKKIDVNGKPHLCLFALNDIKEGEEVTYDYGGEDCPWRTKVGEETANDANVENSNHPFHLKTGDEHNVKTQQISSIQADTMAACNFGRTLLSKSQMDDATGPTNTTQQISSVTDNAMVAHDSRPSLLSKTQMDDATGPTNTTQQTSSVTDNAMVAHDSRPSRLSKSQMDDATGPTNTTQQISSVTDNAMVAHDSRPSHLSKTQMDDATGPTSTTQQISSITDNAMVAHDSRPSLLSKTQMDDATGPTNTTQQISSVTDNAMVAHDSRPSHLSKTQMDDATGPTNTTQQTCCIKVNTMAACNSHPCLLSEMDDATGPANTPQQIVTCFENKNEVFVPRLRRTKSVIIKDTDLENSDELYDSTSEGEDDSTPDSSDNYIPDTTSERDSDDSLKPKYKSHDDLLDVYGSVSSPVCDSTTSDKMISDRHRLTSEVSGSDEEPCSSQNVNDSIVVGACTKKGGKRVYNKRQYCLYCCIPYAKMARHLEHAHQDKSDVAKALSFPKGSKERKTHLNYIRNRGNYAHNAAVMESGKGKLVPFKRPPKEVQGNDFMHCAYCQGLFTRRVLWRHVRSCRLRPGSVAPKPGKNRVQSMCTYTGPVPSTISKQLWGVISAMNPDPITDIVKNDQVIIDVGQHLLNKGGTSAKNQQSVREKMREMGRLIRNARKVTTLKKMEDLINPKKYMETVKAVKLTCGYDSETNKFLIPSLANKLGNTLVKVSKLLKAQGLISNNDKLVKNASEFQDVHQEKWNELISATALRNIREAKWNVPTVMPFTEDVQKMHAYLTQVQDEWYNSLSESPSTKAWMELAKVCLAQIILFNRRREGEVASMPLSAFSSRDTSDPHVDVDWALSEVEKKLCRHFSRIVIRGKRGRPVPILLTPKMLGALELLVKQREACGVLKDNGYMFARPEAMTHFRGSDCIRGFAKACGARCPESLTSTRLRKHAATLSTVLNMTDTEMDQLANFLGHDIRIHREFYRLPEKTLQLAKISKVLMALEQGRLAEFHGKNLDEIGIDPDEKILDSDEDTSAQEEKRSSSTSTVDEPSAEESLSPTKKNEMPPPPPPKKYKRLSDEDETPSRFGAMRHSSKGKATQKKKRPWKQTEVQAVERHMNRFITACTVPAKSDCERCLRAEPEALKNRDWQNLKFYVYNRITAYKKKL